MKRKTIITLLAMAIFAGIAGVAGTAEIAGGQETGGAPASDAERIAALERQVAELQQAVAELRSQVAALQAQHEALFSGKPEKRPKAQPKPAASTAPESTDQAKDEKLLTVADLVAAAKKWNAGDEGETDAAKRMRQKEITDSLHGRRIVLKGTLLNVNTLPYPGSLLEAQVKYVSRALGEKTVYRSDQFGRRRAVKQKVPAESVAANVTVSDAAILKLRRGSEVTAEVVIDTISFSVGGGDMGRDNWQKTGRGMPVGAVAITINGQGTVKP